MARNKFFLNIICENLSICVINPFHDNVLVIKTPSDWFTLAKTCKNYISWNVIFCIFAENATALHKYFPAFFSVWANATVFIPWNIAIKSIKWLGERRIWEYDNFVFFRYIYIFLTLGIYTTISSIQLHLIDLQDLYDIVTCDIFPVYNVSKSQLYFIFIW